MISGSGAGSGDASTRAVDRPRVSLAATRQLERVQLPLVVRLGGVEFLVLARAVSADQVVELADRIADAVEAPIDLAVGRRRSGRGVLRRRYAGSSSWRTSERGAVSRNESSSSSATSSQSASARSNPIQPDGPR